MKFKKSRKLQNVYCLILYTVSSMKTNYAHAYAGLALDCLLETGALGKPYIQSIQNSCMSL